MDLKLVTTDSVKSGIFGMLYSVESPKPVFHTLEHAYETTLGTYEPKLLPGNYLCIRGQHRLHSGPIETFEITGVPNHNGILFHYGNYNTDSDGCVLVGIDRIGDMITDSRDAFASFMKLQDGINEFNLVVT